MRDFHENTGTYTNDLENGNDYDTKTCDNSYEPFLTSFLKSFRITGVITVVCMLLIIYFFQSFDDNNENVFKLDCSKVKSSFDLRLVTYSLLHGSMSHLLSNLFILTFFGILVEQSLGTVTFVVSYFLLSYCVGLGWYLHKRSLDQCELANQSHVIGASGACYGLIVMAFVGYFSMIIKLCFSNRLKPETPRKKFFYDMRILFGICLFCILVLVLNYIIDFVFYSNQNTVTDTLAHNLGTILGFPIYISILLINLICLKVRMSFKLCLKK